MEILIQADDGLVLVDTSYYFFNRYFATLKWYRISTKKEVDIETLHEDETFVNAFRTHIKTDITKFAMFPYFDRPFGPRLPLKNKRIRNKIMFCLDCKRSDIWRMALYPEYKAQRKQASDMNMFMVGIFHEYLDTLTFDATGMDISKISASNLEADDVVYLTIKRLRTTTNYAHPVLVISNDNDFLQLLPMNAIVTNMKGDHLVDRMVAEDSKTTIMLKVLLGDPSDNIKPVSCMTQHTAAKIAGYPEKERQAWIAEHGSDPNRCIKEYKQNKKLILLSRIPKQLVQAFHDSFRFIVA